LGGQYLSKREKVKVEHLQIRLLKKKVLTGKSNLAGRARFCGNLMNVENMKSFEQHKFNFG
jgi:hypothetical protein